MTKFRIDYTVVKEKGPKIKGYGDTYIEKINTLYEKIDSLQKLWKGDDGKTYINLAKEQEKDLKALGIAIQDYGVLLGKIASYYEEGDDEATSAAKRMLSQGGR